MSTFNLPLSVVAFALKHYLSVALDARRPRWMQRWLLEAAAPLQRIPAGTVVRRLELARRAAEKVTDGATEPRAAVLYLHGGAYTVGSLATHRSLAAHLARESSSAVYTLDYRLAPENPFPAALDDAVSAFLQLVTEHEYNADRVVIAGDSAGGGLAAAATRALIDRHGVTPAALALISPWVDPGDRSLTRKADLVLNTAWLFDAADAYLASGDRNDPGFAPMLGSLDGFPPTRIHCGTSEVLYGQIMSFKDKLAASRVDVSLIEYGELWHVAHAQASVVKEAAAAVADLGAFIRAACTRTTPEPTDDASAMRVQPGLRSIG